MSSSADMAVLPNLGLKANPFENTNNPAVAKNTQPFGRGSGRHAGREAKPRFRDSRHGRTMNGRTVSVITRPRQPEQPRRGDEKSGLAFHPGKSPAGAGRRRALIRAFAVGGMRNIQ